MATTPSVEGMHLVAGEEILVADGPEDFAEAIVTLYTNEALWTRLSIAGLANVPQALLRGDRTGRARSRLRAAQRKSKCA